MTAAGVSSASSPSRRRLASAACVRRAKAPDQPAEPTPVLGQGAQQAGECGLVDMGGDPGQGPGQGLVPAGPGQDFLLGGGQHFVRVPLVHDREVGRQPGLQGKATEQGLAEGVDGLDVHAAVQDTGEQAAGAGPSFFVRGVAEEPGQAFVQLTLRGRRPGPQALGHPVGHLGGGGLGEGEAEDAPGRGAGQNQGEHPVGQHLGLAGAGGRRHPHRSPWVCGPALGLLGILSHGPSSPPATDHSLTRARCS